MAFPSGDPIVEKFLRRFVDDDFDVDYHHPDTKRLIRTLTLYQSSKGMPLGGPLS